MVPEVLNWLSCMHIEYSHGHIIINLIIHKEHNPITYLKLIKILIPEHIKHLISAKVPDPKALIDAMLGDHFPIEVIYLDKVWELESEVLEETSAGSVARLQVLEGN